MIASPDWIDEISSEVNDHLRFILSWEHVRTSPLLPALEYALFSGGKRLRPLFLYAIVQGMGSVLAKDYWLIPASSIELIHNYSLVHDDLPAMDNDDFRRGLPTVHMRYGEGEALLTGSALLNLSFECLHYSPSVLSPSMKIEIGNDLLKVSGIAGLLTGQAFDLKYQKDQIYIPSLRWKTYFLKTGLLFETCAIIAWRLALNKDRSYLESLLSFCQDFSLAFQVMDDWQDMSISSHSRAQVALNYAIRLLGRAQKKMKDVLIDHRCMGELLEWTHQKLSKVSNFSGS